MGVERVGWARLAKSRSDCWLHETTKKARKEAKQEHKAARHEQREERRREMEFVPKQRFEGWAEERVDDL